MSARKTALIANKAYRYYLPNMMGGSKHKLLACVGESQHWSLRSHAPTAAQLASTG